MTISRDSHPTASIVDGIIRSRRAVRYFRPDPVPQRMVEDILDVARFSPSNSNIQPWHVYVLAGPEKAALSERLRQAQMEDRHPPLQHLPDPLPEEMRVRQEAFGSVYYRAMGISRSDMPQRAKVTARNFDFFGAPVGLIFAIDPSLTKFSWLDYGLFIQTIMIAASAIGLATCPQVSFVRYQDIISRHLDFPEGFQVVCGMSLGFSDDESLVNRLDMTREPVEGFTRFLGFDA
ncbi:nitroreductase [Cupriavidus consociatus]|uniref:nitroreductase n=1 Tax=Cupriavidus consociatus TaxID=2821357 RepID=UPI001AE326FE|nr:MULTISPECIES: nitroreductase [unclassified Cupriavidus]MBP0622416.1 nitroreductase [Cupriavidus sp. LEh25]MDK2659103.1 nitroreductase [Cupriavidus sp. LEh21]